MAPHWQIFVELRAGRPLTHSLDSIAFVWNRFPPVFSPQTGRSTEGPRFRVGLLKNCSRESTVDPVELLHLQLDGAERPAPGPHSMNPWEPVEGWVPYVETVRIPYVYSTVSLRARVSRQTSCYSKRLQSPPIFHMHLTIVHMCNCLWTSLGKVRASAASLFWAERVRFPSVIQSYWVGSAIATVTDLPMGALTCARK